MQARKITTRTCTVGSKTDDPCTRPATEHVFADADEAPDTCLVHAILAEMGEVQEMAEHVLIKYRQRERLLR